MKNSKFRRLKVSARTLLLFSAVGGLTIAAGPAVALFRLLKPERDADWLKNRRQLVDYVFTKLDQSKFIKKLEETHESLSKSINDALDLGDQEPWKKDHDKLYKNKPDA